jgi:hypothetical protein
VTKARMMAAAVPVLVSMLAGCAPADPADGPGAVADLRVTPAEARAGDEVMLTLENRSDRPLGYNLCPAVLDRRAGADWEEWPEAPAEVCTMELRTLSPESSSSFRHTLPSRLEPGEYRFRTTVEAPLGEGRVEVASEPFAVGS